MQFHAGSSLRTDFGNWYVPTIDALHNLCRAAGFSEVRTVVGPPPPPATAPPAATSGSARQRLARRIGGLPVPAPSPFPPSAPSANYRAVVHAFP
jgi:hypothetical protein